MAKILIFTLTLSERNREFLLRWFIFLENVLEHGPEYDQRQPSLQVRPLKIFENSFFKNVKLEFWSKAPIFSIWTYSWNENYAHNQDMITKKIVV